MEAVLGATAAKAMGIQVGQTFVGTHGLGAGGHPHGDSVYTVVGILAPGGSVLDRLILTDTASVWKVHEDYTAVDDDASPCGDGMAAAQRRDGRRPRSNPNGGARYQAATVQLSKARPGNHASTHSARSTFSDGYPLNRLRRASREGRD
jgi:hypothetical protein